MTLYKDIMQYFKNKMHVYGPNLSILCGLPWKIGCPKIWQMPILGTQYKILAKTLQIAMAFELLSHLSDVPGLNPTLGMWKVASDFNPFTLRAAKTGLAILEIFCLLRYFPGNIWRRDVDKKLNNNPPSNILWTFTLFLSYFQKYERSRRSFSRGTLSVNGLSKTGLYCMVHIPPSTTC